MAVSSTLVILLFVYSIQADETCKEKLEKCQVKSPFEGLPTSLEQVNSLCKVYKTGMECINNWNKECLTPAKRIIAERHMASAQFFMGMLCDDPKFKKDYINHTDCFGGVSDDWIRCTNNLQDVMQDNINQRKLSFTQRLIDSCCAKHGFNRCIYLASRAKCSLSGAILLRRISETLSKDSQCVHFDNAICGANMNKKDSSETFITLLISFIGLLLSYRSLHNFSIF